MHDAALKVPDTANNQLSGALSRIKNGAGVAEINRKTCDES